MFMRIVCEKVECIRSISQHGYFCFVILKNSSHCSTPATQPASSPAHSCMHPVTSQTSTDRIALLIILCDTSPIAIGHTPGRLSRARSCDAVTEDEPSGSTYSMQSFYATKAILEQS